MLNLYIYAKDNHFINTKFFVDDDYSGTSFTRPAFMEMMELAESEQIGIRYIAIMDNIDSVKIVAQNYIIVLQEVIQKTNIFIDAQNIKILLLNHVQVILLENIS